jgi:hypothetical protein
MSNYGPFVNLLGAPDPSAPSGLRFGRKTPRDMWDLMRAEIGAGWYRDGFLYLFGEGLDALDACLDAWSFVVPASPKRMVLGRNAHGAILVLENEGEPQTERVCLLDPFTVSYTPVPNTRFLNLVARALPKGELPSFVDDRAYRAWREQNGVKRLELEQILGFKTPKSLGGTLTPDNLQLEDIVEYYQTTAPIYADAFAKLKK